MRARIFAALSIALALGFVGAIVPACVWTTAAGTNDLSTKTCTFQGSDTACGKCVVSNCQAELDDVCKAEIESDAGDSVTLGYLDDCASGSEPYECEALSTLTNPSAQSTALVACLGASCSSMGTCSIPAPMIVSCASDTLSESTCGACIASNCAPSIANCCGDSECKTTTLAFLTAVAECTPDCTPGEEGSVGTTATDTGLYDCAMTSCGSSCMSMSTCTQSGTPCSDSSTCCSGLTCLEDGTCGSCTAVGDGCSFDTTCCPGATCDMDTGSCL